MEKQIEYRGTDLVYSDRGAGLCILLLHGYLETGEIWRSFMEQFPSGFRLIVPDLPGHGASGSWGKVHTMEEVAGAINAILEFEGIDKVLLAGHSMGGYVTMAFAALFPEKLLACALVHSTPFPDTEEKRDNRDREISLVHCGKKRQVVMVSIPKAFATDNLEKMSAQVDRARQIAMMNPDDGIIALLRGMKARTDRTAVMQDPRVPLLLIGGMKDNYIPVEVFDKLVTLAPHASVLRLKESGHMGFVEEPELVAQAFLTLLAGL